jgi:hypothetical protein
VIRAKTVFVVGAGASCELNFPSGAKLLSDIAAALDIRFADYERRSGDDRIFAAFEELARQPDGRRGDANPYLYASWRIRDAAQLGLSIDNIINQLDDDPLVPVCGKLAIAREILQAERKSVLMPEGHSPGQISLSSLRPTWLGRFMQLAAQDVVRSKLDAIFENASIISFNYDRSVRQFLPFGLMSQFAVAEAEARALAKTIPIFHPYGSLGPLPWETPQGIGTPYGAADDASLTGIQASLRTFTEQVEDDEALDGMRAALNSAERVIFLGFGYHRQNMELLSGGVVGFARRVFGTSLGLSKSDEEVVGGQLRQFLRSEYKDHFPAIMLPLKCTEFIDEHFRTFTS